MNLKDDTLERVRALLRRNIEEADVLIEQARLALAAPVGGAHAAELFVRLAGPRLGSLIVSVPHEGLHAEPARAPHAALPHGAIDPPIGRRRGFPFYRSV